jgi:hypothetical protein
VDRLRCTMIRAGASGWRRWRLWIAASVLMVAQVAAVSHLIGHSAGGDNSRCAICLAVSHSGSALPVSPAAQPFFPSTVTLAVEPGTEPVSTRIVARYRARAPPVSG